MSEIDFLTVTTISLSFTDNHSNSSSFNFGSDVIHKFVRSFAFLVCSAVPPLAQFFLLSMGINTL